MNNRREVLNNSDSRIFSAGTREDWNVNFPETLGEHVHGNVLFPKIFDEMILYLEKLTDYDYANFIKKAFIPLTFKEVSTNLVLNNRLLEVLFSIIDNEKFEDNYKNQVWILYLDINFRFCFEKIVPIIEDLKKINSAIFNCPTLAMVRKDFSANRFRDIRNALAHCNYYLR